ncbi:hypothetical protein CSG01_034 [Cronobacter phage SG01]|uniref:Uncharacterized protein n=1 Tax=Cronobacter phage CS01 TaxID=2496544 RepID=A0A3B8DJE6_9CAUD|nr:hypothetical protein HOU43_gp55 [Cronobacter phage CS01]AYJ73343.1 hypothetical protein CS01_055 [Cronobacter phage CS01]WDS30458.1 hypothetical protein CSG01_034 [Cronobacter phage SG01]
MSKSFYAKCTSENENSRYEYGRLYRIVEGRDGKLSICIGRDKFSASVNDSGLIFDYEYPSARFTEIETRTIKCVQVKHHIPGKKSFTEGKRYRIEKGRALGAVGGIVFDNDGYPWNLYRDELGFSCADTYYFEAKYF